MTAIKKHEQGIVKRMQEAGLPIEKIKKELSFANQLLSGNKKLQECTTESLVAAIVNIANTGLTLNPIAKEAALTPRWNSKLRANEAVLLPMYPGLVRLAKEAGAVKSIVTNLVHENDVFELDLADNIKPVKHNPCLVSSKKGDVIGAYSVATLPDGTRQVEWMDIVAIHEIRNNSDSFKYFLKSNVPCPWTTHEGEMIRKTVLRRLCKYLPRGENEAQSNFDRVVEIENDDYPATTNQLMFIDNLLPSANISPEQAQLIDSQYHGYTYERAKKCIKFLEENQLDDARYTGTRARSVKQLGEDLKNAVADEKR
jgi:phage RecT family recombinase